MEFKVVSWNVNGWHTIRDEQLHLLEATDADIALLQEVTPASMEALRTAGWQGTTALELLPPDHTERNGASPRFSCAVVVRDAVDVVSTGLVPDAPSAVRGVWARVRIDDREVFAVSAALPPGSMWGRVAKVQQANALARLLERTNLTTVVGMDRNGPKLERWDPAETEWWREDPADFFDKNAAHGCVDVLDVWLEQNPGAAARAMQERPDGPRAVSYVERRADPPIARRYDVILASRSLCPSDVGYRYEEAVEAGSDHGLVEAALRLG